MGTVPGHTGICGFLSHITPHGFPRHIIHGQPGVWITVRIQNLFIQHSINSDWMSSYVNGETQWWLTHSPCFQGNHSLVREADKYTTVVYTFMGSLLEQGPNPKSSAPPPPFPQCWEERCELSIREGPSCLHIYVQCTNHVRFELFLVIFLPALWMR